MPHDSSETVKQLLRKLDDEMQNADIDAETRMLMRKLDVDLRKLMAPDTSSTTPESTLDHAKLLQARFSTNHPVAERFLAEVINALVKMGV
jgi:hypothetical protein